MNVRAQVSMVFHLDKCIGCHTCSLACKNLWTSRPGTEYMWWNNVETKPGTGYPTLYEDQDQYDGGWKLEKGELKLRLNSRAGELLNQAEILACCAHYNYADNQRVSRGGVEPNRSNGEG